MADKSVLQELTDAFVEDHRTMTRGYRDARQAVEANDLSTAREIAGMLDENAGSHIEFEESCLYPIVAQERGAEYAARLYAEHDAVLRTLIELQNATVIDDAAKARWLDGLQEGLEHAATCGTLLSHLSAISEQQQQQLLQTLRFLQTQPVRWSERTPHQYAKCSPANWPSALRQPIQPGM